MSSDDGGFKMAAVSDNELDQVKRPAVGPSKRVRSECSS